MNPSYVALFTPGQIGHLRPKNRLVLAPMVRNYAADDGSATPRYIAHVERVARGGVGTLILEASFVRQDGKGFAHQLGIHSDDMIVGLRALVAAGHRHGALMGVQLYHGGRQASARISGSQPFAPSAIPDPLVNELPHAMTPGDIAGVVAAFGAAAGRAQQAGFDFVELHGAHGYLIAEFLSPFSNRRTDAYGGTPEKRRRFLEQVFAAARAAVGPEFPVTVRLSAEERIAQGLALEETIGTARRLEQLGAAALHISNGNYATYAQGTMIPPMAIEDGVLLPFAQAVKQAVRVPVIAVGKLRTAAMAEAALTRGQADFIALGRTLLADPDWPIKVATGHEADVRRCIACNQGCISRLFAQEDVWCTVNPEAGFEQQFENLHGGAGRKLLIVGGGPAGMAAARWGALAGFNVVLHEARPALGGQLRAAAAAPHREDWRTLHDYFVREIDRLGVEVHVNSVIDAEHIQREQPWAVIIATGATPVRAHTAELHGMRMVTGRRVLEQDEPFHGRVVVAGGGCAGAQAAEYLAERGHGVTVLEAGHDIALDAPVDERALLLARLERRGVQILRDARLAGFEPHGVIVQLAHEMRTVPADMVVLCLGARPVNELAAVLTGMRGAVVGDAQRPRKVTDAIAEGAQAVLALLSAAHHRGAATAAVRKAPSAAPALA